MDLRVVVVTSALLACGCTNGGDGQTDDSQATATGDTGTEATTTEAGSETSGGEDLPEERMAGDRSPLTAPCDDGDPLRCALPWPSSVFLRADDSTATGVRVALESTSLADEDPAFINLADGFSRVTPLVTGFPGPLDIKPGPVGAAGPVRLLLAQYDHPERGSSVPLRLDVFEAPQGKESLLLAYATAPLLANADYVAVVLDDVKAADGTPFLPERSTRVALDLELPVGEQELALWSYHGPTRALLAEANIDPERVLRVWDFTTRSREDPSRWLTTMREEALAALTSGEISVEIDSVVVPALASAALVVEGRLLGIPAFASADGLSLDAMGLPVAQGTSEAPFRVVIPEGIGDYRVVIHGHGTGGSYHMTGFDRQITELGLAKVSPQIRGWNENESLTTFGNMVPVLGGVFASTAGLLQSLAEAAVLIEALGPDGPLTLTLSADTLGGQPNPAAGRKPDLSRLAFEGTSMGGSLGMVLTATEPRIDSAALLVSGAAWTNFVAHSLAFDLVLAGNDVAPEQEFDVLHALAVSQLLWDPMDGAPLFDSIAEDAPVVLLMQSIGDGLMPSSGTNMLSVTTNAVQLGAVLEPIPDVEVLAQTSVANKSAITQYRMNGTPFEIHDLATSAGPAGDAAREQLSAFLASVRDGAPEIRLPTACPGGNCDFSQP